MAVISVCSVQGCGKPTQARGLCFSHWKRWRRYGDPTAGRIPHGETERYVREVVLPYDGDECLIWPYACNNGGYAVATIGGEKKVVSRFVCERVKGPAPSAEHEAAHSCGRGAVGCVTPGHVSWKTPAQNHADKIVHGTHNRGERHPLSKLTEDEVISIRSQRGAVLQRDLAKDFGITQGTVSAIQTAERWGWLK